MLVLPGDPDFDLTLFSAIPPGWQKTADRIGRQCVFVASAESGLLRPATPEELDEYLYGGEYDEAIGDDAGMDIDWD